MPPPTAALRHALARSGACLMRAPHPTRMQARHATPAPPTTPPPTPRFWQGGHVTDDLRRSAKSLWKSFLWAANSGLVWGIGLAMGCTASVYLLVEPLKTDTVTHSVDMTTRVMKQEGLKGEVLLLSRTVVSGILQDDASVELLTDLVRRLGQRKEMEDVLTSLAHVVLADRQNEETVRAFVGELLEDPDVLAAVKDLATKVVEQLRSHPELCQRAHQYLASAYCDSIAAQSVQESAGESLPGIFAVALSLKHPVVPHLHSLQSTNSELKASLQSTRETLQGLQGA